MKKFLSLTLALLMMTGLLAACGDTGTDDPAADTTAVAVVTAADTEDPYHDENGYLLDSLPELNYKSQEIQFLYDTKYVMPEFFVETQTGEPVSDAIYARNLAVEDRLGVKFSFTGEKGSDGNQAKFLAKAEADVQSDCQYSIYCAYSRTIPLLAYNGLCANLLETEYFDVEKPWWPEALTNECTVHDVLYFCTGDISTNMLWMMSVLFYNQEILENQHLDQTPYQMIESGTWTLDKFCEIVTNAYIEGADASTSTYGLCGYKASFDAFLNSAGVISIDKDGNGDFKLSDDFTGEKTTNIVEKLGKLYTVTQTVHYSSVTEDERNLFYNQHALFLVDGTYASTQSSTGSIDFDYGIMPLPKYDENQEKYQTNLRYPTNMYAINTNAKADMKNTASAVLEALCSDSYRRVTPVLFETTMKTRYSKDSDVSKTFDIVRDGVVFDVGRLHNYSINNYYPNFRNYCFNGGLNWASCMKGIQNTMSKLLPKLSAIYEK